MKILAIDPGTKCGWALRDGVLTFSGTWNLKQSRFDGGGMRYVRLRRCLDEVGHVDQVVYEEVRRHMGTDAAHIYGGVVATITAWCEQQRIPYTAVPVGTIKKHATGKGNASKEMMIQAFAEKEKRDPVDDNEADAYWILQYALSNVVPEEG